MILGFSGIRRGWGSSEVGGTEGATSGVAAELGTDATEGIEAGLSEVRSPRSSESSLRVSRSIALTANHDDNEATSIER